MAKTFGLIQQSKWQDIIKFILDSAGGKEEVKSLGIDILYIAVEQHAPIALMTFLFDILESENGRKVTLNSTQFRKALYNQNMISGTSDLRDSYLRKWEEHEHMNVAKFLSKEI